MRTWCQCSSSEHLCVCNCEHIGVGCFFVAVRWPVNHLMAGRACVCVWACRKARLDVWSMTGVNYESVCLSVSHRQTTDNGLVASVSVSNVEIEFRQLGTFFFFFFRPKKCENQISHTRTSHFHPSCWWGVLKTAWTWIHMQTGEHLNYKTLFKI